jgi:hypothetical protein
MANFVATRRPLIQSAAFANFSLSVPTPPPQRSCHGKSYIPGHWQSPNSCTSVESALKREARGAAEASLSSAQSRSSARGRAARTSATKGTSGDVIPALPLATAPAAEHAAAHPPSPAEDERDGSPGASSSGVSDGCIAASVGDAQAAVEALKAELQDMRKQVAAQAALTAQQSLTISSLERALQKTRDGASANSSQGALLVPQSSRGCPCAASSTGSLPWMFERSIRTVRPLNRCVHRYRQGVAQVLSVSR